jgi:hypothetical protein
MARKQQLRWVRVGQRFYCVASDEIPLGVVYPIENQRWACEDLRGGGRRSLEARFTDEWIARVAFETIVKAGLRPISQPERSRLRRLAG